MGDFLDYFKNKKNLINLLLLGIIILALPLGITLLRQEQIIKSRAAGEPVKFTGENVITRNGQLIATSPRITLELTSPLGPPRQAGSAVETGMVKGESVAGLPQGLVKTAFAQSVCSQDSDCPDGNDYCVGSETYRCTGGYCDSSDPNADANGCVRSCGPVANNPANCSTGGPPPTDDSWCTGKPGVFPCNDSDMWPTGHGECKKGNGQTCTQYYKYECTTSEDIDYCSKSEAECDVPCGGSPTPVPSSGPCSVSWSLSTGDNPSVNVPIQATVTGISDKDWQGVKWRLDSGQWSGDFSSIVPGAKPTFIFNTNSGSAGQHTLTLSTGNETRICTPSKTFKTKSPTGGTCDLGNKTFGMNDACASCIIAQAPQQNPGNDLVDSIKAEGAKYGNQWGACTDTQLVGKWCAEINQSVCDSIKASDFCSPVCAGVSPVSCTAFSPEGLKDTGQIGSGGMKIYSTADYKGGRNLLKIERTPANGVITPSSTKEFDAAGDLTFEKTVDGSGNWLAIIPDNLSTVSDNNYTVSATVSGAGKTASCTPFVLRVPKKPANTECGSDISSTEARMKLNAQDSWVTDLTVTLGETVFVGGFHNNQTEQVAGDVVLKAVGPQGPSSHEVTLTAVNNNITFTPSVAGKYTVTATTAGKTGQDCTGSATLTVNPVPVTTVSFRVSDDRSDLEGAPWMDYTSAPMSIPFEFKDKTPGIKTVFVQFKDSKGKVTNLSDCPKCQAQIRLLGSEPVITGCKLDFEGVNTVLTITGHNFGTTKGTIKSGEDSLTVKDWKEGSVRASIINANEGEIIPVTLTNGDGQTADGQCSAISQLSFGAKLICKGSTVADIDNVNLSIAEAITGGRLFKQKVKLDKDGIISNLTQKLEAGKPYVLSIKAPGSLRKTSGVFTAGGGMTVLRDFILPVGDIFPAEGDGAINALDKGELNRQWIISSTGQGRSGDFNKDGRVNSIDWACMRHEFGKTDEPEVTPGEPANPNPGGNSSSSASLKKN